MLNITTQENVNFALKSMLFFRVFVSNKMKIVSNIVKMVDVTNANKIITNLLIVYVFLRSLVVSIRKESVLYAGIPSLSIIKLKNTLCD